MAIFPRNSSTGDLFSKSLVDVRTYMSSVKGIVGGFQMSEKNGELAIGMESPDNDKDGGLVILNIEVRIDQVYIVSGRSTEVYRPRGGRGHLHSAVYPI